MEGSNSDGNTSPSAQTVPAPHQLCLSALSGANPGCPLGTGGPEVVQTLHHSGELVSLKGDK